MSRFSDLFWSQRELWPAKQQEYMEQQLPLLVAGSNLHWRAPGDPLSEGGNRILVGVGTFSEYDMRLLDLLDAALGRLHGEEPRVDVFSVLTCRTPADFERLVPGIGQVFQTPVIGIWENGELKAKGSGARARDELLVRRFGLNWAGQQWGQSAGTR